MIKTDSREADEPQSQQLSTRSLNFVFNVAIAVSGIIIVVTMSAVLVWRHYRVGLIAGPTLAGVFGDFLSGVLGPLLSLVSIYFVVVTLREQQKATLEERQKEELEAFENRFFELLKLHRDNVGEMELKQAIGRKTFVLILREWRCIMNVARELAQDSNQDLTQLELIQITYNCLFYGVGPNSSRMPCSALEPYDSNFIIALQVRLDDREFKREVKIGRKLGYTPFEGHQSRLGHYYRHLYQMVRYVQSKCPKQSSPQEYMRIIRAQLSTHEQALLLLNTLTPIGAVWWNLKLIDDHKMVRNIPKQFFEPILELDAGHLFDDSYFERPASHVRKFESLETKFAKFKKTGSPIWHDVTPLEDSSENTENEVDYFSDTLPSSDA